MNVICHTQTPAAPRPPPRDIISHIRRHRPPQEPDATAKKDEPTANLLLAMAHLAGVEIVSLGPSTGRLDL
jgi:hypothetical protein